MRNGAVLATIGGILLAANTVATPKEIQNPTPQQTVPRLEQITQDFEFPQTVGLNIEQCYQCDDPQRLSEKLIPIDSEPSLPIAIASLPSRTIQLPQGSYVRFDFPETWLNKIRDEGYTLSRLYTHVRKDDISGNVERFVKISGYTRPIDSFVGQEDTGIFHLMASSKDGTRRYASRGSIAFVVDRGVPLAYRKITFRSRVRTEEVYTDIKNISQSDGSRFEIFAVTEHNDMMGAVGVTTCETYLIDIGRGGVPRVNLYCFKDHHYSGNLDGNVELKAKKEVGITELRGLHSRRELLENLEFEKLPEFELTNANQRHYRTLRDLP